MALGKLFRRFSLQALSKRWLGRFGRSLRSRFLRQQDVHRRHVQLERLEERSLLTTLYWLAGPGASGSNWNADNWSTVNDGVADTNLRPQSGDTLIFDTSTTGFNTTNGFVPTNDLTGVTDLKVHIVDASSTADFEFKGNPISVSDSISDIAIKHNEWHGSDF